MPTWYLPPMPSPSNGYPWNYSFLTKWQSSWYAQGDIQIPNLMWRIDSTMGLTTRRLRTISYQTEFINTKEHEYPRYLWRIYSNVNDGYPYTWVLIEDSGESTDPGEFDPEYDNMTIGGNTSNFDHFTKGNAGSKYKDNLDNRDMADDFGKNLAWINSVFANMFVQCWALTPGDMNEIMRYINTYGQKLLDKDYAVDALVATVVQQLYGGSMYDYIISARLYPFDIYAKNDEDTEFIPFGIYLKEGPVSEGKKTLIAPKYSSASEAVKILDFGYMKLDISQAWEIDHVEKYIYLPYCGLYPISVKNNDEVHLILVVDLFSGTAEYTFFVNGQIYGTFPCTLGIDIPLNFTQGMASSNIAKAAMTAVSAGVNAVASGGASLGGNVMSAGADLMNKSATLPNTAMAFGGVLAGGATALAGGAMNVAGQAAQMTAPGFDKLKDLMPSYSISAPAVGNLCGVMGSPIARIISHIPVMHKDADGYGEMLGYTNEKKVDTIKSLGENVFFRTKNYKTELNYATTQEKLEIERLLAQGVFT